MNKRAVTLLTICWWTSKTGSIWPFKAQSWFPVNHWCGCGWFGRVYIHFSSALVLVSLSFCTRCAAWPVSGRWRMKRRSRGRRGGRCEAPAARSTLRRISGHCPATCPSAPARRRHAPFRRALRCSAGRVSLPLLSRYSLLLCAQTQSFVCVLMHACSNTLNKE